MLKVKKSEKKFYPDCSRVIVKPHVPKDNERIKRIINRVLNLTEKQTEQILENVIKNFSHRHKNIWNIFMCNYNEIKNYIPENLQISDNSKALLGAYFTCEYSVQAAAFFNPSVVPHPDQSGLEEGSLRFILSFRSVGEGHISSIEFRSGIVDKNCNFTFDEVSPYAERANVVRNPLSKKVFEHKEVGERVMWLAKTDYDLQFKPDTKLSEKVIFPASQNDCNGIEDARFVQFKDDDGTVTYYATYTAYDGQNIMPQIIETKDFINFKIITLSGKFSKNKGMALFPRKINGKYAMISRVDGENLYIMYSDDIHFWQHAQMIRKPELPWEFMQIGNCGSPIETDRGWILLTHGVGPMREYSIGIILLDLENPSKIIGQIGEPILVCNSTEREGYVPNVVYSCGSMIHNGNLIIPYAMSDICSGIATVSLEELFSNIQKEELYSIK
ncbi:MAG: glycoside hydrolase family 130 protein [Candidatus Gastranaerophilales bacterium]|nr:glycoside hydrolase family 130 protein [Candidatus Gastranaerophilales bacterium]